MKIVDRAKLHVEQVTYLAVVVCVIPDAIKLEIDIAQASFGSLSAELLALGELDSVCRRLHGVVPNLP